MKKKVIKTYRFPSKSVKGDYNTTKVWDNGEITCDCFAGLYQAECWHIKKVREYEQKKGKK